ncbi:MAG: depupylase/deamidase Dop [Chloroflexi bacterium OHK40]
MATLMGIETEYGVALLGAPPDPFFASQLVIQAYQQLGLPWATAVSPLASFDFDRLGDPPGALETSLMLTNGARLYIDHAHPEYCTPECGSPLALVAADKAGERILAACQARINGSGVLPAGCQLRLYKNNSDHKGNSYGCHENYLVPPGLYEALVAPGSALLARGLLPFLVTRQIFCGAGKVGSENGTPAAGFQLTQRADFFETITGHQTTYNRPIFNLRDEPHADPRQARRLHVICGDATMAELSTFLKVGTAQIVLAMLAAGAIPDNLAFADPVAALRLVSRDLSFAGLLALADGRHMTARELQLRYLELAHGYLSRSGGSDEQWEVLQEWEQVLGALAGDPAGLGRRLDWAIKRQVLERYLEARGLTWELVQTWEPAIARTLVAEEPTTADLAAARELATGAGLPWGDYELQREAYFALRRLDLEYHDLRQGEGEERGLYYELERQGLVERLLYDDDIEHLRTTPPAETRAWARGHWIARFHEYLLAADWGGMILALPHGKARLVCRLNMLDPLRGSAEDPAVEALTLAALQQQAVALAGAEPAPSRTPEHRSEQP